MNDHRVGDWLGCSRVWSTGHQKKRVIRLVANSALWAGQYGANGAPTDSLVTSLSESSHPQTCILERICMFADRRRLTAMTRLGPGRFPYSRSTPLCAKRLLFIAQFGCGGDVASKSYPLTTRWKDRSWHLMTESPCVNRQAEKYRYESERYQAN